MSETNRPIFPAIHLPQFADEPLPEVVTAKLHHPVTQALDDVASATRAALAQPGLQLIEKTDCQPGP